MEEEPCLWGSNSSILVFLARTRRFLTIYLYIF